MRGLSSRRRARDGTPAVLAILHARPAWSRRCGRRASPLLRTARWHSSARSRARKSPPKPTTTARPPPPPPPPPAAGTPLPPPETVDEVELLRHATTALLAARARGGARSEAETGALRWLLPLAVRVARRAWRLLLALAEEKAALGSLGDKGGADAAQRAQRAAFATSAVAAAGATDGGAAAEDAVSVSLRLIHAALQTFDGGDDDDDAAAVTTGAAARAAAAADPSPEASLLRVGAIDWLVGAALEPPVKAPEDAAEVAAAAAAKARRADAVGISASAVGGRRRRRWHACAARGGAGAALVDTTGLPLLRSRRAAAEVLYLRLLGASHGALAARLNSLGVGTAAVAAIRAAHAELASVVAGGEPSKDFVAEFAAERQARLSLWRGLLDAPADIRTQLERAGAVEHVVVEALPHARSFNCTSRMLPESFLPHAHAMVLRIEGIDLWTLYCSVGRRVGSTRCDGTQRTSRLLIDYERRHQHTTPFASYRAPLPSSPQACPGLYEQLVAALRAHNIVTLEVARLQPGAAGAGTGGGRLTAGQRDRLQASALLTDAARTGARASYVAASARGGRRRRRRRHPRRPARAAVRRRAVGGAAAPSTRRRRRRRARRRASSAA